MKKIFLSFLLVLLVNVTYSQIVFNTGSAEFDADLNVINVSGESDMSGFKSDMTVSFNVSVKTLDHMLSLKMIPGEIYLSLEIARIVKRPVEDVIPVYKSHKSKGWGYIAKEMGIKPGSAEFHALKGSSKSKGNKMKNDKGKKGKGKKG